MISRTIKENGEETNTTKIQKPTVLLSVFVITCVCARYMCIASGILTQCFLRLGQNNSVRIKKEETAADASEYLFFTIPIKISHTSDQ